jgi:hypothetical protein
MAGVRVTEAEREADGRVTVWAVADAVPECPGCGMVAEIVHAPAPAAREVRRKAERMGGEPHPRARILIMESYLVSAEEPEQDMLRTHRESWVDTVNDLGMTPREAALAGGDAQAEVEMMLDDLDWNNDRQADLGRPILMDVDWIRRELGIEAGW